MCVCAFSNGCFSFPVNVSPNRQNTAELSTNLLHFLKGGTTRRLHTKTDVTVIEIQICLLGLISFKGTPFLEMNTT